MAVDANVIIFERLKEELAKKVASGKAFEKSFKNAMSTIIDGNVTTLIVAFTLYFLGSGMVKGFGLVLALGVLLSLLTALVVSKFILKQEIVWKNRSQNFDKIRFYPFSERIYWLVKNPKTKLYNKVGLSDVWEFKNMKRHKVHKATFPIDVPKSIIS